ncbi:MAG: hypothetical protein ABIO02_01415 [Patescibacteria group bacterium]
MNSVIIVKQIIHGQEAIIGPMALEQAKKVAGIQISSAGDIKIQGNEKDVLTSLVEQYEKLFGRASVEVCKDAVKEIRPAPLPDELPEILR